MTELVVISGKGGTGKTTVAGSLVALAKGAVAADCDVDAANLHLILRGEPLERVPYRGSEEALIDQEKCVSCGACRRVCRFDAVLVVGNRYEIDPLSCEGCGACAHVCPAGAIRMEERQSGWIYVSRTPYGILVHGELLPGEENSGKLVTQVKMRARMIAGKEGAALLIVDGSPGIGCPVIASLSGAHAALIVAEPSRAALHDLLRVAGVARHFRAKLFLVLNKADLSPKLAREVGEAAAQEGMVCLGEIPYDEGVTWAQLRGLPVVETHGPAATAIREIWEKLRKGLYGEGRGCG
ncbi:MAG: ATP-binding protein [Candidatus Bipolaricaulaceae bacterium]